MRQLEAATEVAAGFVTSGCDLTIFDVGSSCCTEAPCLRCCHYCWLGDLHCLKLATKLVVLMPENTKQAWNARPLSWGCLKHHIL